MPSSIRHTDQRRNGRGPAPDPLSPRPPPRQDRRAPAADLHRPRHDPEAYAAAMGRYGKRDGLIVHEDEPFNAETGAADLAEASGTATDAFSLRGHGAGPELEPGAFRLHVGGLVERELTLSMA